MQASLMAAINFHKNPTAVRFPFQFLDQETEAQALSCLELCKVSIQCAFILAQARIFHMQACSFVEGPPPKYIICKCIFLNFYVMCWKHLPFIREQL